MLFDKACAGSRAIREPTIEYINCTNCGTEVEIWTDELKATCPSCGNKVFRAKQVSCIDWCPHAKECVGPEVYERLGPQAAEDLSATNSPLDILKREHERALDTINLLRAAILCLKLGALKPGSPVRDKGISHLGKVLAFFDGELKPHFRREEEVLFPVLERHLGVGKSPTKILCREHGEFWQWYEGLRKNLTELQKDGNAPAGAILTEIQNISRALEQLLREHTRKENESLLPLAKSLLQEKEIEEISNKWRTVSV